MKHIKRLLIAAGFALACAYLLVGIVRPTGRYQLVASPSTVVVFDTCTGEISRPH